MNDVLKRAEELKSEIIENRRHIHEYPEIEMDLPRTTAYVMEKLRDMGYQPKEICKSGIVATVGNGGKTILLRADMDALPMMEDTDLSFKSKNNYGHTCGHDTHIAMLLGAARILKENENELKGTVKLMFQPAEENLTGAKAMIDSGLLENPHVDAAMAMHIGNVDMKTGELVYKVGEMYASADRFKITINGKGGHGASPEDCVDPINVAVHVHLSLQEIISREVSGSKPAVLTIGRFCSGDAGNIIPDKAVMEGSIRTYSEDLRKFIKERLVEISELTAQKFRAKCTVEFVSGVPALVNDEKMTTEMVGYAQMIVGENLSEGRAIMGSEDFALIAQIVPSTYFGFGAGSEAEGYIYGGHHPKVRFNEDAFTSGAAVYANCAIEWLKNNQ